VVKISIVGDDVAITSRPDPYNQDTRDSAADGEAEPRTLEILEEVEEDDPVLGIGEKR